jgi:hypothetical protein
VFRHISRIFSPAMLVTNDSIPSRISDRFFLDFSVGWKKVMPHRKRWAARLFLASALLAPQVCFADILDKYVGEFPFSKVGGRTLFQVPKVRESMRKLLGRERLKFVLELDRAGPVEVLQDAELGRVLYVFVYQTHNIATQASLLIRSDGETIAACISDYDDTPEGHWTAWIGRDWQIKTKGIECGLDGEDAVKRLNAAKASAKGERQPAQH